MTATTSDGSATRNRRDPRHDGSEEEHSVHSDSSNHSDEDLDALLGISGPFADSLISGAYAKQQRQQLPHKPQVSTLHKMLQDVEKITMVAATGPGKAKKGGKGTAAAARPIAQSMRDESSSGEAGGGGGDDDAPKPITLQEKYESTVKRLYRPVPYEAVTEDSSNDSDSESGAPHRKRFAHIRECFLCSWGDRFHDGIYGDLVNRLHAIFSLNYGRIENAALAQQLHLYFKKRIWQEGMPMLTQEIALTHIEQLHSLDPRITVGEMIRHYHRLFLTFQNEIYYSNGGFNPKAFAAMNHAGKMILSLYKSDPIKMNFYNPDLELDTKQMGRFSNIMANFSQKPRRDAKRPRDDTDSEADHNSEQRAAKRPHTQPTTVAAALEEQRFFF